MKKQLRGIKRQTFLYDYSLYRTNVPIPDVSESMKKVAYDDLPQPSVSYPETDTIEA